MVEIDADQLHIIFGWNLGDRPFDALRSHVLGGPAFAVLVICAFQLVRCYRTAPQEVFRKFYSHVYPAFLSLLKELW
ncbi:hypothetical protein D3C73_1631350 [compost metagenome]